MKHKLLLAGLILLISLPLFAEPFSGTCGTDLYWSLDTSTGILSISGAGTTMDDYTTPPWYSVVGYIKSISLPSNLQNIGEYSFRNCEYLTSIAIHEGITSIGKFAFLGCKRLKSIIIPESVASIGSGAFESCISLNGVYISDIATWCKISFIDKPFGSKHNLYLNNELVTELTIPNGITNIGEYTFAFCSMLSITIPSSVTTIED